ncbi:MAG: CoA transferase, partial [Rhodobiaceae bacterium]|nr:CoA transferase [Rhodobiaceae bacterium]
MSGPLADVRVVEFAGQGPAPFAGGMLAEMGADVVRVDRSGSQTILSRRGNFYDRNKRSILLNLKDPSDKAAALGLVARADLIIEGFRPGVMEKLGLGPDTLLAANPAVVIGRMTGWGQTGPMAMQPGHDINYLALTGALHAIGPAEYPVPPLSIVADIGGGGLYLVVGLLSAMHLARRTGIGQVIDAAMVDGVTHMMMIIEAFHQEGRWEDRRGV